jgi:peptide/nickel transport system permease protein
VWKYIARRLVIMPVILLGISLLTFTLIHLAPGDPITIQYGFDPRGTDPATVERMREDLGLNAPLPIQYMRYLGNVLHGDMGKSLTTKNDVSSEIMQRIPATLELAFAAMLIVVLVAIPLGIICALNRGSIIDNLFMSISLLGVSMPPFWFGIMLILLFSLTLGLFPSMGRGDGNFIQRLPFLVLPALTLGTAMIGIVTRVTRSSMLDVLNQDYLRTAHAKGIKKNLVLVRHALPNALIPVVTILALQFAGLLGGSVIIENIFAWPGIGRLAVNAIMRRDYPIVMGTTLVFAAIVVLVNLLLDIFYSVIDPRIRLE